MKFTGRAWGRREKLRQIAGMLRKRAIWRLDSQPQKEDTTPDGGVAPLAAKTTAPNKESFH